MAEPLPDLSPDRAAVARLAELESALAEARAIQRAQADTIQMRNAELADNDAIILRLKADRDAAVSAKEVVRFALAQRDCDLADARRMAAAMAENVDAKRELYQARRDLAASDHAADRARGALVGLAYRLGELENDRLTRERNRAAGHAILHHNV